METRANYVLVGAFAILGLLGLLGFFLWFANVELDRQFAYYDVDFDSVSGLSAASDVRFAGLPVGQVVSVALSPANDGRIRVRVEIGAETPVRTDSVATIEAQGVTGVAYVGISSGTPEAPLLRDAQEGVPMIEAGRSMLQSLTQDAPEILSETLDLVRDLRELMGGENRQRIENILANVEQSSISFGDALEDFSGVTGAVSTFASEIQRFNSTLDGVSRDFGGVLDEAEQALASINALSEETRGVVARGGATLDRAEGTLGAADAYITGTLGPATERMSGSVTGIETRFAALADSAEALAETLSETGRTATARLAEAQETLARVDTLIASLDQTAGSVDSAAQRLDGMLAEDASALIAELRTATAEATEVIRSIGETADTDLAAIFDDIRAATAQDSATIDTVGRDLSSASGRLDGLASDAVQTLADARETFANANDTLAAINGTLETGDRALGAAERAFDSADTVLNDEIGGIAASLRSTLDTLEAAVGDVAAEIPAVAEELRSASRSAEAAFAGIEGTVDAASPAVRDFAATALPQFGRLAVETRALIDNLDALIGQIRRDPSRFFLDPRAPEYRR